MPKGKAYIQAPSTAPTHAGSSASARLWSGDAKITPVLLLSGATAILLLMPFHAFLTVWLSQIVGHYTALRLWKEFVLALMVLGATIIAWRDSKLRQQLYNSKLCWLIGAYLVVQALWGIGAYLLHQVTATALGYGLIINTRFLIFFLVVWLIASRSSYLQIHWSKLLTWPAVAVILIGIVQYFVLPYDVLRHFGYSASTIYPFEDINHNSHYIRIMSTLRGANPLGAYLVLVLSLLAALWIRRRRWWYLLVASGGAVALILSFSRSAWIGLALSAVVLVIVNLKTKRAYQIAGLAALVGVAAATLIGLSFHNNPTFQNTFLHTEDNSGIPVSSNEGHASALTAGLHDAFHEPLGLGPGTAGPASAYNAPHPLRIAENYFLQIAQETGWLGLAIFGIINLFIAAMLWQRRTNPLALALLAALVGISLINLLSHAWTDDTLAYLWWGLAAVALASAPKLTKKVTT